MTGTQLDWISALLIGLAGGVHCVGMCGGVVAAFSFAIPKNQPPSGFIWAYNLGRIGSYTLAGALAGYLGALATHQGGIGLVWLKLLSAIMLILMALYLANIWKALSYLEQAGSVLWKRIQPISKRFLPFKTPMHALPYGAIWGWLPCGLVYSTLSWSLASGSALNGALVMLCFGFGTLPTLIALGHTGQLIRQLFTKPGFKLLCASLLAGYGSWLGWQALAALMLSQS